MTGITWKYTETRPNTNVPFYDFDENFVQYGLNKYGNYITGFIHWDYSEDQLQRIAIGVWSDSSKADEFDNDEFIIVNGIKKQEYCEANGIIRVREIIQNHLT
jgi:hypothetical protein